MFFIHKKDNLKALNTSDNGDIKLKKAIDKRETKALNTIEKDKLKSLNTIEKGAIGEKMALKFLKKQKYKIIETNFRTKFGEIDIIAKNEKILSFIEVKWRSNISFGQPSEAVDYKKQHNIRTNAVIFIQNNNISYDGVRFDIVEIIGDKINLLKNAF